MAVLARNDRCYKASLLWLTFRTRVPHLGSGGCGSDHDVMPHESVLTEHAGPLTVGSRFGDYRVCEELGRGATGIVVRAERVSDGTNVALKVLRRELSRDETYRRRLTHEARAAQEIEHKYVVPLLDFGEIEGQPYLAFGWVPGRSLADRIADAGPLSIAETVRVTSQVGAGLDALHKREIVHRDVKPSNIILTDDERALLTDFGLAKGRAYTMLTRPGQLLGTANYVAPELIRGEPATPASDIYALGCTVYECVTGAAPFAERGLVRAGIAHLEEEPPNPCAALPDAPSHFGSAVCEALAKDPANRPHTAAAYARMLALASDGA